MVKLTPNLLDALADKLFMLHEMGLNQDGMNTIFKFMLCSSRCKKSVLRQFKQMKRAVFHHLPRLLTASTVGNRSFEADFHREETLEQGRWNGFQVKGSFVGYLMQYGLLHVKHLVFDIGIVKEMGVLPAEKLKEMCVIDIVSELLGLEETSPGVSQCQPSDLQLDSVEAWTGGEPTQDILNQFVALAPKKLEVHLHLCGMGSFKSMEMVPVCFKFPSIETVCVGVRGSEPEQHFDETGWADLLHYFSVSCPGLRLLDVQHLLLADGTQQLADQIEEAVHALRDTIFPNLMRVCDTGVVAKFEMLSSLYPFEMEELHRSDHPVLRLGEAVTNSPLGSVSRSVVVKRGEQVPWQISFHIHPVDEDSGDDEGEDLDYDDYDGFDDAGFDDYEEDYGDSGIYEDWGWREDV